VISDYYLPELILSILGPIIIVLQRNFKNLKEICIQK